MSQVPALDPFENPSDASPPSRNASDPSPSPSGLREPFVLQAVKFLADPRVQSADPRRAVEFLMGKNLTENEVRAAFSRLALPFPEGKVSTTTDGPSSGSGSAPNVVMLPPGAQLHVGPPTPSTWSSWLWSATAVVGFIGALRELLRRYLVPLYLRELRPEFRDRVGEQLCSEQITELRDAVQELTVSSRETSQRLERLSITLSSTGNLESNGGSSERIEALGVRLSQSGASSVEVATSIGESDRPRGVQRSGRKLSSERPEELPHEKVDEFCTSQETEMSLDRNLSERSRLDSRIEGQSMGGCSEKSRRRVLFKSERQEICRTDSGDEFMSMIPASVEESWAGDALRSSELAARTSCSSTTQASSSVNDPNASSETSGVVRETLVDTEKTYGSDASEPKQSPVDSGSSDKKSIAPAASESVTKGPDMANSALERFRETMRAEAELVASGVASADAKNHADSAIGMDFGLDDLGLPSKRLSTASAPAPDTALSDVD